MRTMNFVRFFQKEFRNECEVDIAFTHGQIDIPESKQFTAEFNISPLNLPNGLKKNLRRFFNNIPSPIFIFSQDEHDRFKSIVEANDYDYILFRYLASTQLIFSLPSRFQARSIIDFDDIPSDNIYDLQFGPLKGSVEKAMAWSNRILLNRYEKKCLTTGASLFCSEQDLLNVAAGRKRNNLFVVPNIFHNATFEKENFGGGFSAGNVFLFVGALDYSPNVEGLKWFIEDIFKAFRRKVHDAKLIVVGRSPLPAVPRLCDGDSGIELHANVPDVKPFYKQCRAVIVPVLTGGGTRIKILEAALSDRPIFSTPLGASGLDFKDGSEIHLFLNLKEFIEQYHKLDNYEAYISTIKNARKVVINKYSKSNFQHSFDEVLNHINLVAASK